MATSKNPAPCSDDVLVWADGTWCYRENLSEFLTFMSDDFEVLYFDTDRWNSFDQG